MGGVRALNIVRHGNVKEASKYMETVENLSGQNIPELDKNKFGVGKRFRPMYFLKDKKQVDVNPWNYMKFAGRVLLAEDAAMFEQGFALELALAMRAEMIRGGTKLSGAKLRKEILDRISGSFMSESQHKAIEGQLGEQVNMLRQAGIEPDAGQIKQRRLELIRSQLNLSQEILEESEQLARGEIFTDYRGGIFTQMGDALGRIFRKNVVIKVLTVPKIPFTGVLGRVADMQIDTLPFYGMLRAAGWSPTSIIARMKQWERTGNFKSFLEQPAKAGLFRSAQLGVRGSKRFERQMARSYAGLTILSFVGALLLGDDDDEGFFDLTGALSSADWLKKAKHDMGAYTLRIGPLKFRYLNYPIINMPLAIIGNYKDGRRMGKPDDELDARLKLLSYAFFNSLTMVQDTWLAKGINDLVNLIGGAIMILGNPDKRHVLKEDSEEASELAKNVNRQLENLRDDYIGVPMKYISPFTSNLVQQIIKFGTPEGRLKGTGEQLWLHNAGFQWFNDKRTDIFGQEVKTLPGDMGIAWPRETDDRWKKMWDYKINLTDIEPRDKKIIDGTYQTLEWEQYLERKKLANDLFKKKFDEYFEKTPKERIEKKLQTFTVQPISKVKTNQVHEDLNKIWSEVKQSVDNYLFVWDEQSQKHPQLMRVLMEGGALPNFYNEKMAIEDEELIPASRSTLPPEDMLLVPYNILIDLNKKAIDMFIEEMSDYPLAALKKLAEDPNEIDEDTGDSGLVYESKKWWQYAVSETKAEMEDKIIKSLTGK